MKKNLKVFKKGFINKRGTILVAVSLTLAAIGVVALGMAAMALYKVTNNFDGSQSAYYAAQVCANKVNTDLLISSVNIEGTCVEGADVDFANSTPDTVDCADPGSSNTIYAVGTNCTCTTQIMGSTDTTYSITSTGVCPSSALTSGSRNDDTPKYSVSITKTLSNCSTCAQLCPTPLATGASCVTSCGVKCEQCCAFGAISPACDGTPPVCQN